ncbi:hypothetical protein DPEC_G00152130 [Dallia pectoralis]|uniref:Uncharacterized protein n=1 Tax=Dallia pectoralis TaxID=75939 RepID=A0ACC2GJK5_DALPE|nr:hypothetical protein DPEC_G00152130 [Dallia pectoralis]
MERGLLDGTSDRFIAMAAANRRSPRQVVWHGNPRILHSTMQRSIPVVVEVGVDPPLFTRLVHFPSHRSSPKSEMLSTSDADTASLRGETFGVLASTGHPHIPECQAVRTPRTASPNAHR